MSASTAETPVLALTDIRRDFRMGRLLVRALRGVTMDVLPGEFLVVMGPSGCGKSTLLTLIGGLDRPTAGSIVTSGDEDITRGDETALAEYRRRWIGFIFQSYNLIATMTARQNVEFPLVFAGVGRAARRERAEALLTRVGLGDRMTHRPIELSGGQQQRVAIARALANAPAIVLGDEPTGNLDTRSGQEIMDLLLELNRAGTTLIVVTHDARLCAYAHRVVRMEDGVVLGVDAGGRAGEERVRVRSEMMVGEGGHPRGVPLQGPIRRRRFTTTAEA
ncbi:MAG: ABC transporter ATP-binding protein [Ardenticatenales bacterium]|jgi:putative ABC transport system ATP-binding protein|nr:ABC transporter ATP-binding protein [Ardenticatenales bacterium]